MPANPGLRPTVSYVGRLERFGYSGPMLKRLLPDVYEGWLIVGSMAAMIVVTGGAFA